MMTKQSMAQKIKAAMQEVSPVQIAGGDSALALVYRDRQLEALCQGIIEEIQQNAKVRTRQDLDGTDHQHVLGEVQ